MIVAKFGGTSVADAAAVGRLIEIVRRRIPERPLIVVSALAGVTDALLGLARQAETEDPSSLSQAVASLVHRHEQMAQALPGGDTALEFIAADAEELRSELVQLEDRSATPAQLDAVAARGELWSSRLVAAALVGAGIEANWVDVRPLMITDTRHTRATPYLQVVNQRARDCLKPLCETGQVPVTQGFIGSTATGAPTTLGRGGSDFTAALLGAALGVSRVEIWTDVDGLMTADPRIVPSARTLARASYEEAAELATFGAKILHPATALPLVRAGIPIVILNSTRPDRPGTMIEPEAVLEQVGDSPIRSISWKQGITVINIRAPRMLGTYGFLRALFEIFERHETVVDVLASGEVSVSLTIEDRSRLPSLLHDLGELGEVWIEEKRAIIAIVGIGLRNTPGLAARVFNAVWPANVEVISQGASSINMTFVVREEDGPDVVRRLHREFFGSD
ncbi:MAG TPA: lysine-sensitive aspartokinase 3 [Gemmatimonadales bacterium]|jgi:aspartate kinase|nr:lysine-sensitive aspartokinase 3 [Gemmatimonadales bacterium]